MIFQLLGTRSIAYELLIPRIKKDSWNSKSHPIILFGFKWWTYNYRIKLFISIPWSQTEISSFGTIINGPRYLISTSKAAFWNILLGQLPYTPLVSMSQTDDLWANYAVATILDYQSKKVSVNGLSARSRPVDTWNIPLIYGVVSPVGTFKFPGNPRRILVQVSCIKFGS